MLIPLKGVSIQHLNQGLGPVPVQMVQFHWSFQPRPKAAIQKHSRGTSDATTKIGSQAPPFEQRLSWLWETLCGPATSWGDHNPSER